MVKVLFFGMLASRLKTRQAEIELTKPDSTTLSDVLELVKERYAEIPDAPFMFAVNEEQAELSTVVKDGDEVAIMPPFSGGSR